MRSSEVGLKFIVIDILLTAVINLMGVVEVTKFKDEYNVSATDYHSNLIVKLRNGSINVQILENNIPIVDSVNCNILDLEQMILTHMDYSFLPEHLKKYTLDKANLIIQ